MKPSPNLQATPATSVEREIGAQAKEILGAKAYRFCHEPTYPWTDDEAEWCSVAGADNDRCEALPRACRGEMGHAVRNRRRGGGDDHEEEPFELHLPQLGPIVSYMLWAAIGVAVVLVIRAIAKRGFGKRSAETSSETVTEAVSLVEAEEKSALELDVQRLLDRARRAAAEGRFADGIAAAYAALLRQLEGERLIRVDPWRTNGDYLRDLSPMPEVRSDVGRVVRNVEAVQFGRVAPSSERFETVLAQVLSILSDSVARKTRGVGVARAIALASLVLTFVSCLPPRGAEDDSPSGTSAVFQLLHRAGLEPRMRLRSLAKDLDADQIVLLPGARVDAKGWEALRAWVDDGGTLVIANGDPGFLNADAVGFGRRAGLPTNLAVGDGAPKDLEHASIVVPGTSEIVLPKATELSGESLLERDGSVYAAQFWYDEGSVIALADNRLLTNASLAMADNAAFVVGILKGGQKKIDLVGALTGTSAKSPLSSVERGKLAPVLLQLGLVLVLFFLYKGVAFGTLTDPPRAERRSFAEHARALGLLYAKAHAAGHARTIYGAYALERLRDSMLFRDQKGISALAEVIAARTGQPLGQVALMLVEAQEPRPSDPKATQEDLDLIRKLSRLLRQSKGGSK